MCYLTLLFTRKHCQTIRGRSPGLSILHAFPNCFSGFDMHDPSWTYSCATARDLHTIPVLISYKENLCGCRFQRTDSAAKIQNYFIRSVFFPIKIYRYVRFGENGSYLIEYQFCRNILRVVFHHCMVASGKKRKHTPIGVLSVNT